METEYFVRRKRNPGESVSGSDFSQLVASLRKGTPTAGCFHNPFRVFLANGGSVSLESGAATDTQFAMLETATPECRSPRELICYQIAMEKMLCESVDTTFIDQDAQLMKGSSDAYDHTYGQHESYEMCIAKGLALVGWRIGLILMFPLVVVYQALAILWLAMFFWVGRACKISRSERWGARWIQWNAFGLRCMHLPLALSLWFNILLFALRPHRKQLPAYLASRCILDGAGHLDPKNLFWISARAASVNAIIGFGSYRGTRPMLRCDSWLRGLCMNAIWSSGGYFSLFRPRQRVEIAIGDSGLCEQSQYIRVGATSLAIDVVERTNSKVPCLRDPVGAIARFARDWMLLSSAPDRTLRQWTALDIQHAYAGSVRQMLQSRSSVPIEAWRILDQWQTTLNQLRPTDDESNLPRSMLGRIDWLSKLWLLHQLKSDVSWQTRKKIDLRYHELSQDGYHRRLSEMLSLAPIMDPNDIARARRMPPTNTPATQRGYLIREFDAVECELKVDWTHAEFYFEGKKRRTRFC